MAGTTQVPCPAGKSGVGGSALCVECAVGRYQNVLGSVMCKKCSPGAHTSKGGMPLCEKCPIGKFGNVTVQSCSRCFPGRWTDVPGSTYCKSSSLCPVGKLANVEGTGCEKPMYKLPSDCKPMLECLDDRNDLNTAHECILCPLGGDCDSKQTTLMKLLPKDGYLRYSWSPLDRPFSKCPLPQACKNSSCEFGYESNESVAPLCAKCADGFILMAKRCEKCTTDHLGPRAAAFIVALILITLLLVFFRKRVSQFQRRYGAAWREILLIFTIQVSFTQIGSSLPELLTLEWPHIYMSWLERLKFMQFDILSIIGATCLPGWGYEASFAGVLVMVILVPCGTALIYLIHLKSIHKLTRSGNSLRTTAQDIKLQTILNHLFQTIDMDSSGDLNEAELMTILEYMGRIADHKPMLMSLRHLMSNQGGVLKQEQFVRIMMKRYLRNNESCNAAVSFISRFERHRMKGSYISIVVQMLLLLHAPVSQKVFLYFHSHNLSGRLFLRADYSIEVFGTRWARFLPIVVFTGIVYTVGLPVYILCVLLKHRHSLRKPRVIKMYGFLYRRFTDGAEFWEIHEIFRKTVLCGAIVYAPPTSRAVAATLVCVISCCSLNYFKPPRNKNVFAAYECAFIGTTFKYLGAILIEISSDGDRKNIGIILLCVDVLVMISGIGAMVAVLCSLKRKMNLRNGMVSMKGQETMQRPDARGINMVQRSLRSTVSKVRVHARVRRTETESEREHNRAINEVRRHQAEAHNRLTTRLQKRVTLTHQKRRQYR